MPLSNNSKYPSLRPSPSVKYFMVFTTLGVPDRAWVCSFIAGGWRGISMLFGWWRCGLPSQEDKEISLSRQTWHVHMYIHTYTHKQTNKQTNTQTNIQAHKPTAIQQHVHIASMWQTVAEARSNHIFAAALLPGAIGPERYTLKTHISFPYIPRSRVR